MFTNTSVRFWCNGTLCNGRCYDHCNYRQMLCLPMWKMLLPQLMLWCGRQWVTEADVIAYLLSNGRCYSHVADGIATLGWIYFSISSEMLNRIRDGLLTLIYIVSLKLLVGKSLYDVQNTRGLCAANEKHPISTTWVHHVLWCKSTIYISDHRSAIEIHKKYLEEDKQLQQRTTITVNSIICLLKFCLKNTYFLFQGRYYE